VKGLKGYSRWGGSPTIKLTIIDHIKTFAAQRRKGGGTYGAERVIGYRALRDAGISKEDARKIIEEADKYFHGLGVGNNTPLPIPRNRRR
jgi:hypothetical protein